MITIDEKLSMFTKLVYDKVEKQNQQTINKFNEEFGNIIKQKEDEFTKQAEIIEKNGKLDVEKRRLQIMSKTLIEEKRTILEKKKEIYDDAVNGVIEFAKSFLKTDGYKDLLFRDLEKFSLEIKESKKIELYLIENDINLYGDEIIKVLFNKDITFVTDNEIIGGFIAVDNEKNIKIDMSILNRILSSKGLVGDKVSSVLK